MKWEFITFAVLGYLVGSLVGLSGDSVVEGTIAALFVFGGGSALTFREKLVEVARKEVAVSILVLCLGTLAGVYHTIWLVHFGPLSTLSHSARLYNEIEGLVVKEVRKASADSQNIAEFLRTAHDIAKEADAAKSPLRSDSVNSTSTALQLYDTDKINKDQFIERIRVIVVEGNSQ